MSERLERAKLFHSKPSDSYSIAEVMAKFADAEVADALKAVRVKIADEVEARLNAKYVGNVPMDEWIKQLRETE